MKINRSKRKSRKPLIAVLLVLLLTIAGYTTYAYFNDAWPFQKDEETVTEEKKAKSNSSDDQNAQQKSKSSAQSKSENVDTRKTTDEIPVAENVTVSINSLSQNSDGIVEYRASASQAGNGTCSALFTSELGKPVTRTSETTNGTCSAKIPGMEFDALGKWTLTLRYYSNNTQAVDTKDVNIR